nr:PREDICTED: uncharacterized protein LOC108212377 [Daucus carota subsp. sativus]
MVLSTFYGALNSDIRLSLDVAAGGNFKKAHVTQAKAILEELASNNYAWAPSGTSSVKSTQDTEMVNLLTLKLDALTQEVCGQRANVNAISTPMEGYNDPGTYQYPHAQQFPEEAALIQGGQSWSVQNNSYYNPNQRPNNNLSYNNNHAFNPSYAAQKQQPPGFQPRQHYQNQQQFQPPPKDKKEPADWEIALSKMIQGTTGAFANMETKFEKLESRLDHMASSQKMLEDQIGQIANKVGVREQGSLPSQPDLKGNEQCKAITLRNGRELPEVEAVKHNEKAPSKKDKLVESEVEVSEKENDEQKDEIAPKVPVKPYVPPIPLPQRLYNKKLEKHAVIQKSIPQKLKDPGSFSLPCTIGKMENIKALCDLGASVSLMPYSICKRLGLGELKKTRISLQSADRTIKHPLGVKEDVLVKVDKFFFPCDFVVLDMDEDVEMPIILGRPFLDTAGTTIDVKAGKLILNVGDEKVEFDLKKALKMPLIDATCFNVDIVDEIVKNGDVDLEEEQAPTDK